MFEPLNQYKPLLPKQNSSLQVTDFHFFCGPATRMLNIHLFTSNSSDS